jgi:hypothetical protein
MDQRRTDKVYRKQREARKQGDHAIIFSDDQIGWVAEAVENHWNAADLLFRLKTAAFV